MIPTSASVPLAEPLTDTLTAQVPVDEAPKPKGSGAGCHSRPAADLSKKPARAFHPRLLAYLAFFATVFASLTAAATVASNDVPLLLGGF